MKSKIQRVELNKYYYVPIHCPFCGKRVIESEENEEIKVSPCIHTLFVAHDMAFEYRSDRFNENLNVPNIESNYVDDIADVIGDNWENIDHFTDKVSLPDAVKFASYVGPPSFYGTYIGFSPLDED